MLVLPTPGSALEALGNHRSGPCLLSTLEPFLSLEAVRVFLRVCCDPAEPILWAQDLTWSACGFPRGFPVWSFSDHITTFATPPLLMRMYLL